MVEIAPVHGTGEKRTGFFLDFYNQWPAILRPAVHNWQDFSFTIFEIAGENSRYKRSWEVSLGMLGFNLIVTYVYRDDTPNARILVPSRDDA